MTTYAITQEHNLQTVLWNIASTLYRTATTLARFVAYLVSWVPALLSVLQVTGKVALLGALIVACVLVAAMYPAAVVGAFGVWVALQASKV